MSVVELWLSSADAVCDILRRAFGPSMTPLSRPATSLWGNIVYILGGVGWFGGSLVNAAPQFRDRISIVELSSRSFEAASSAREISREVNRVLELGH